MPEIEEMTKDELCEYAKDQFNTDLNKRHSLDSLMAEVLELESKGSGATISDELVTITPDYLKHPTNGRVFVVTKGLLQRGDMIPCDKDGNSV